MNTITNHFVEGHANERFGEDRVELALVDGSLDRRLDDGQHCRSEAGRRLGLGHEAQRQRPQDGGRLLVAELAQRPHGRVGHRVLLLQRQFHQRQRQVLDVGHVVDVVLELGQSLCVDRRTRPLLPVLCNDKAVKLGRVC